MRQRLVPLWIALAAAPIIILLGCGAGAGETPGAGKGAVNDLLTPAKTIALPGVSGRIDHFAIDRAGHRLFMAALGNKSVEVIDLNSGQVSAHIENLPSPQGIAFAPDLKRLAIACD